MAVLRHQLRILSRRGKRPRYSTADRALLAAASRFLPRERWSAFPVAPDTLTRWRRHLVTRKRSRRRRGPGRPPIDPEVRELILRMARENPRWGYLRIKGELLKLGITVSATTIANVIRRGGLGPAPRRIGPTWSQFLRAQALAMVAAGGVPGSAQEEDRHEQARTPPAQDGLGRPSLEEGWCRSEAPGAASIRHPERGWERAGVLSLHRPSRTQSVPRSLIGGANPRDGPAATRLRLPDWRDRMNPADSHTGIAPEPDPCRLSEPPATVRWLWIDGSARPQTRWRWPIEFLYPTGCRGTPGAPSSPIARRTRSPSVLEWVCG